MDPENGPKNLDLRFIKEFHHKNVFRFDLKTRPNALERYLQDKFDGKKGLLKPNILA